MTLRKSSFASLLVLILAFSSPAGANEFDELDTSQAQGNEAQAKPLMTETPEQGYDLIKNDVKGMEDAFNAIRANRMEELQELIKTYGADSPEAKAKNAQIESMGAELKDRMPRAYAMMERAEGVTLEGIFISLTNWTLMLAGIAMFGLIIYRSSALIFSPDEDERRDGLKYTVINFLIGAVVMFIAWYLVSGITQVNW